MRYRVTRCVWMLHLLLALAAWAVPVAAQPAASATEERVAIPSESAADSISSLIKKGRTLESSGRWAEALAYYEDALREHPEHADLAARFDLARLHYSLEQRYDDRSFRDSLRTLQSRDVAELYNDVLSKISAYYYTTPPWEELVHRGGQSLTIALADGDFLTANGIQAEQQQLDQLRHEVQQLTQRYSINTQRDAVAVAAQTAQLVRRQVGLSESAVMMEFIAAAAGGLDHFSAYLTGNQLRDIYSQIDGDFVGLGVELKSDDGALLIVRVIPNSPAERAGIHGGDRIVAVDGQATGELSTDEAASLLTGAEGSVCRVSVVRDDGPSRRFEVVRAHVEVPSLEDVKIVEAEAGVAYIRIPAFQKTTARDLEAALWKLHGQGMKRLILDLRGNPGGLLSASVEVADKFIAEGPIVSTRGRSEQENFNYRAHRPGTWRVPLVVLIDGDSASASEIFAAAIQDSRRGKVVGDRSYGKGSVQGIFPLGHAGAGARITTAKFFSPLGHPISNVGVSPDIDARRATLVTEDGESASNMHTVGYRGRQADDDDTALDLAVQAIRDEPAVQL